MPIYVKRARMERFSGYPGAKGRAFRPKGRIIKARRKGYFGVRRTMGPLYTAPETKYFDSSQAVALPAVTTVWPAANTTDPTTVNCLFAPALGNDINNRIGRKCMVKKIKIRGSVGVAVQTAQSTADGPSYIRIMLVQDNQTNATQAQQGQVMGGGSVAAVTINSFQNLVNLGRFRVLKDIKFPISDLNLIGSPTAGDVVQQGFQRHFKININFKKYVQVNFNATNGGTVADIVDNSFHLMAACSDNSYAPAIVYQSRVSYNDN